MKTTINPLSPEDSIALIQAIENARILKNQKMKNPSTSPLSTTKLATFAGLSYFDIDFKYRIKATLVRTNTEKFVALPMSDGKTRQFREFGTVSFNFEDATYKLSVFQNQNLPEFGGLNEQLFIPFKDKTSGVETFGGGRCLPFELPTSDQEVVLDFNLAINPYNAYNEALVSVFPSASGLLQFSMVSGERKYEDR